MSLPKGGGIYCALHHHHHLFILKRRIDPNIEGKPLFYLEFVELFVKCYLKWLLLRWQHQRIQAQSRPRSTGFITFCPGCTAKVGASLIVFPDLLHFTIAGVRHYQALLFSSSEKKKKKKKSTVD